MLAPLRVSLIQISEQIGSGWYFPYSAGCLQAYAQAHCPRALSFAPIVYRRVSVDEGLAAIGEAEVAGFSCYVWNIRRSLALARALKAARPEVLIVFGGPQVPDQAEDFLRAHPFIDVCVQGEGEQVFTELLARWQHPAFGPEAWRELPGLSYLREGQFVATAPAPRCRDYSAHPSPYLSGVFDSLLNVGHAWKGVWESNRGCPFSCAFCDWGSAVASKVVSFAAERVAAEADWFGRSGVASIYLTDANFGLLPRDLELARVMVAAARRWGAPRTLMTQSAKNAPERVVAIHELLAAAGLQTLAAISLQSLAAPVLTAIRRSNLSLEAFARVQQACLRAGIRTYTDLILGLPGETYASFSAGVDAVLDGGQHHFIQFFDAGVLPNAELAQPAYRKAHGLETVEIPFPSHPLHPDGIVESQEIVIATAAMPRDENLRAHVFAWSTLFWHHTHKLLQPALLLLRQLTGLPYSHWIETLIAAEARRYPRLGESAAFFARTAAALHRGSIASQLQSRVLRPKPGVMLSPELSLQIKWVLEGELEALYQEAFDCLRAATPDLDPALLAEAVELSRAQFLQLFQVEGLDLPRQRFSLRLQHDLPAYLRALLAGAPIELMRRPLTLHSQDLPACLQPSLSAQSR